MKNTPSRAELLQEFEQLPEGAIVDERMAAAVRNKTVSSLQRERCMGTGPRFVRDGRLVGYRKRDLLEFSERCVVVPGHAA